MKIQLPEQVFVGSKPDPAKFHPVQNRPDFHWKPMGGLWTSTLQDGSSEWIDWCRGENFSTHKLRSSWVLRPAVAWLLVLSTPEALEEAVRTYGRRDVPDDILGLRMVDELLDFETLSRDFDGVWIPNPHPFRLSGGLFFNVMDVESTLWFRWNFHTGFHAGPRRLPSSRRRTRSASAPG